MSIEQIIKEYEDAIKLEESLALSLLEALYKEINSRRKDMIETAINNEEILLNVHFGYNQGSDSSLSIIKNTIELLKHDKCTCGLQTKDDFRERWDFEPCEYCREQGR